MMAPDYSSRAGTEVLAAMVRRYWLVTGYAPRVWVDIESGDARTPSAVWAVKSDTLNAFPRPESRTAR